MPSVRPHPERIDNKRASVARPIARVVAGCLTALVVFQLALALGAPLGRAAWGGDHSTLPSALRVAALFPIVIYAAGAVIVLCRSGYRVARFSADVVRRGTWIFGLILVLSGILNFASQSPWERFLMAPVALVLGLLTFIVARTSSEPSEGPSSSGR